jgi:uncharacterized protein YbbK (DUF523 family)
MPQVKGAAKGLIRVGVSACLLGETVRFDGGHKRSAAVSDILARSVRLVSVCPEVELGLGVPREPIHLLRDGAELRLVGERSGIDHTTAMRRWASARIAELAALDLSGYVFKKDSPSCGLEGVVVHSKGGGRDRSGRGLFAAVLTETLPLLPCEEEERLEEPCLRERFLERVVAYHRLRMQTTSRG